MKKIFLILLAAAFIGVVFTGCDETGADVNLLMGTWSGSFGPMGFSLELTEAGGFVVDFDDNDDGYTATYTPAPAEEDEMLLATITAVTKDTLGANLPLDVGDEFAFSFSDLDGSGTGATVNLNIYEDGEDQPPQAYPLTML
jgi:hypothetical protein